MFLKNKNIIFRIRRSKVTDYAALRMKDGYYFKRNQKDIFILLKKQYNKMLLDYYFLINVYLRLTELNLATVTCRHYVQLMF